MFEEKNSFPRWARRLDPLLEAGGTNHWFHLIRDLRRSDGRRQGEFLYLYFAVL